MRHGDEVKKLERESTAAAVDEYLAGGGKITVVESGSSNWKPYETTTQKARGRGIKINEDK